MAVLEFWYEFASTYSYPAAMRIENRGNRARVTVEWPISPRTNFRVAKGWTTSPFNLYPAKGRYMWRDMERICARESLPFRRPDPFPQNTLLAARIATALDGEDRKRFSRAVYGSGVRGRGVGGFAGGSGQAVGSLWNFERSCCRRRRRTRQDNPARQR